MFDFLCKIWMFILKLVDAILDGVVHVIKGIVGALVEIITAIWEGISEIGSSIFSGPLGIALLLGGVLLAWSLLGDEDDNKQSGTTTIINRTERSRL